MAMKFKRQMVFLGSYSALVIMTGLGCLFGFVAPNLIPKLYTSIIASILFFFFGGKMIYDLVKGIEESDEKEEAEKEILKL
jgi:putative Ca2+/H+ antiporter (TMEM165/GDT1 family)